MLTIYEDIKKMIPYQAYQVIADNIFSPDSEEYKLALKIALKDYTFDFLVDDIITIDSPYYEEVLKVAIQKSRDAYKLIFYDTVLPNNKYFEITLKATLDDDNNDYAYKLILNDKIPVTSPYYEMALQQVIQEPYNIYGLIENNKIPINSTYYNQAIKSAVNAEFNIHSKMAFIFLDNNIIDQNDKKQYKKMLGKMFDPYFDFEF